MCSDEVRESSCRRIGTCQDRYHEDGVSCSQRGSQLTVSIVIATFNRSKSLEGTLKSVLLQTASPSEVIIVDDSTTEEVKTLVGLISQQFIERSVRIHYARNPGRRSLPVARNIGSSLARGDVVMFLDDDVTLERSYVRQILEVFETHPRAKGVQGFWMAGHSATLAFRLMNVLNRMFFINFYEKDRCRVLSSFMTTYPHTLAGTKECQWLSGCNQSYLRSVFDRFQFDENLAKYAPGGEDVDFSYRICRSYPDSLFITPDARLIHRAESTGRMAKKELLLLQAAYRYYLFFRDIEQTRKNRFIYSWSTLGLALSSLVPLYMFKEGSRFRKVSLPEIKLMISAHFLVHKKKKDLQVGNMTFLDQSIT